MKFIKYPSIENTYRQKSVDYVYQSGLSGGIWVASEKIHGANFSIMTDGTDIRMAKKTALIGEDENFYGCQSIKEELKRKLREIFRKLQLDFDWPIHYVKLCGEIYGGRYPHPDVAKVSDAVKVQDKVWYRPDNDFYGFDIVANEIFIDDNHAQSLFREFDITNAEPLCRGTIEECFQYTNEFITTIPAKLGLPEIEGNICEGVVIKPIDARFYACGSRVIFKNKNPKFSEKNNGTIPKEKMAEVKFDENAQELFDELRSLITENRLRNVLSHIGSITDKEFGKLMGLFVQDALEEFRKDNDEAFNALDKDIRKRMTKLIGQLAADTIRPHFLNIIDNNF